ncbi:MAG: Quinone oxidoreductase [Mycobacterium sp.]|nr:Quinone oxidoreductase [Mycobacterium sp.]
MHAITLDGFGGPEVLRWSEVPDPEPKPGEVLIAVTATAVNRADLLQRQGFYPPPPGASDILGLECSGRIAALGEDVSGWAVGDEVCALLAGGGYAELVTVPAAQVMPAPKGVDLVTAGGLPEVTCTVWSNVRERARLGSGEVLLIHGGTSGIGTMGIQLGVAWRATVAVTVGSPFKAERARELGADLAVLYREQDFVAEVRRAYGGADVVLDNMGAAYLARNVDVLNPDGRLVCIGMQGGAKAELNLGVLLAKRGAVHATSLRNRPVEGKAAVVSGVVSEVWPLLAEGSVRPVVDRVMPLREAARAHELVAESSHIGKVILAV